MTPALPLDERPVTSLRGVEPALAATLERLGLRTVQDLLFHLPLRYEDRTRVVPIGTLRTGDRAVIEGNWGLGESVVSGDITPDNFIVEKASRYIEKNVAHKPRCVVFNGRGTAKADVPAHLRDQPCLEDPEILEILRIAQNVEGYFGVPQDMEWVVDKDLPFPDNVFWVQTRAAKYTPKKAEADTDYLVDQMARLFRL